jgi:hypothetical protein
MNPATSSRLPRSWNDGFGPAASSNLASGFHQPSIARPWSCAPRSGCSCLPRRGSGAQRPLRSSVRRLVSLWQSPRLGTARSTCARCRGAQSADSAACWSSSCAYPTAEGSNGSRHAIPTSAAGSSTTGPSPAIAAGAHRIDAETGRRLERIAAVSGLGRDSRVLSKREVMGCHTFKHATRHACSISTEEPAFSDRLHQRSPRPAQDHPRSRADRSRRPRHPGAARALRPQDCPVGAAEHAAGVRERRARSFPDARRSIERRPPRVRGSVSVASFGRRQRVNIRASPVRALERCSSKARMP